MNEMLRETRRFFIVMKLNINHETVLKSLLVLHNITDDNLLEFEWILKVIDTNRLFFKI
jgi:hypothetical protein